MVWRKILFSVSQVTDLGEYVLFGPKDIQILSNVKHVVVDILFFENEKNPCMFYRLGMNISRKLVIMQAQRFGMLVCVRWVFQLLQKIFTKQHLDGVPIFKDIQHDEICLGCQYGKSHRLPFSSSRSRASTVLELIHYDLLGPTQTASYTGLQYVMVLVDDFSCFSWAYFLEHKSEAFSKFIQFC